MNNTITDLTIVHMVFISIETVALIIFIYFVTKYTRRFKESRDPYTIACFVFIIFAISLKIVLKLYQLIPFPCEEPYGCQT